MEGPLGDTGRHKNLSQVSGPKQKTFNKGAMQGPLGDTGRHKDLSQVSGPKQKKFYKGAMQGPLGDTGRHKDLSQVSGPKRKGIPGKQIDNAEAALSLSFHICGQAATPACNILCRDQHYLFENQVNFFRWW